jgi:hypothetical protein
MTGNLPASLPDSTEPSDSLARASMLEAEGRLLEALRYLVEANRRAPDARLEARLVSLRLAAFGALPRRAQSQGPAVITAESPAGPLREFRAGEVTPAKLREGIARNGCVMLRQLITPRRAAELASGIDRVFAEFDARAAGDATGGDTGWYLPFQPPAGSRVGDRHKWVRAGGAIWTVESPRMLFELCELLDDTGIGELATAHLGERPALSANKCTLRRVPVDTNTNWHQDGAFLGAGVRSLNLWLVLSDCSADSPGLEIVPRRLDTVLPTGTEGAMFPWSVSPEIAQQAAGDTPILARDFRAGDALVFDHMLLHRTGVKPNMTRERYAMETWLFAPSSYPDGQIPLVY